MDLGSAVSDVLILLDCCASGGSRGSRGFATRGSKELIAACGFETSSPAPGKHSFTRNLIEELWDLSQHGPFTVAYLHDRISARLQHWSPYFDADNLKRRDAEGRDIERRNAPVHFFLNGQVDQSSIVLRPLPARSSSVGVGEDPKDSDGVSSKRAKLTASSSVNHPKILISVVFRESYKANAAAFFSWLRRLPGSAESVRVEAVFDHGSSLLLVSMPVAVWDLLPSHPAYSFVGFVRSENLLLSPVSATQRSPVLTSHNR